MSGLYIAGPMRGRPGYNFKAFERAMTLVRLTSPSIDLVFNPAWNDIEKAGLTDMAREFGWEAVGQHLLDHPTEFDLRSALKDDLDFICEHASDILLLPGWSGSRGARTEVALAQALNLTIWWLDQGMDTIHQVAEGAEIPDPDREVEWLADAVSESVEYQLQRVHQGYIQKVDSTPVQGEVRTTSSTGGQKGTKPERYDLVPWEAMDEVAKVYGFGANKYAAHNWRRRYEWGKSIAALLRHVSLFVRGKTYDEETGLHHLAHAVFHCLALITWTAEDGEGSEFDDRFRPDMFEGE